MTATTLPVLDRDTGTEPADSRRGRRFGDSVADARGRAMVWLLAHWQSIAILAVILIVCGLVHGINQDGWPGRVNDDEGTYTAQAYAMEYWGRIAHYTYWYDHPFGGWLLIAVYTTFTHAFERAPTAVAAARECMFVVHLVSCALLYLFARRLALRRIFSALAVMLFSLAPLAVWYQRMAFLDNIAVMWLLAALVCAASPRRSAGSAIWAGVFMAFAFWSKETILILLPVVYLLLRQNRDVRNWRFVRHNFLGFLTAVCGLYVLYAVIKNELFEGAGHVSLIGATRWQLFNRPASGSLLDAGSSTRSMANLWLHIDPYLVCAGVVAAVPALFVKRLRMVAVLLLIQLAVMFRNGYMPYAYVTAMLPFAALCVAGMLDVMLPYRPPAAGTAHGLPDGLPRTLPNSLPNDLPRDAASTGEPQPSPVPSQPAVLGTWMRLVAVASIVTAGLLTLPGQWAPKLSTALTADDSRPSRDAARWYIENVPDGHTVVTDDNIWTDLELAGKKPEPIWFYKLDLDPAVRGKLKNGWQDIDYFILGELTPTTLNDLPLVAEGLRHSVVVKSFGDNGQITIRKVIKSDCPADIASTPGC
ncbi:4-amino-4-deoxy-L-arabinose transferase [Candidatus Protofrankia californiensis]|uniref:4-amino-4-deoxy-L-arabinose transferase n=1 Tax=Candidatus Protofrankia californiensis TaxID=1839754 RepID=UPI001040FEFC|nr:4-amino-4-deoxy-L-arabinose transferase [Candidatus Protofrankia californiensis]